MDEKPGAPLVSAIIVVRDGETFIGEAIDSILAQTLGDWELIVVDDGSVDRTARIVADYAAADPRIRLVTHPDRANHGIAASRNRGISEARGAYVAFLDADDVWTPEKLEEQTRIMEADPELGLVYGRTLIWNSWSPERPGTDFTYPLGVTPDSRVEPPTLFRLLLDNEVQTPTVCNALMRATVFERLGGFDAGFRGMFEDATFFGKALAACPVYVSDRTWARYRQHGASLSTRLGSGLRTDWARLRLTRSLAAAFRRLGATPEVQAALRAEQARAGRALLQSALRAPRRIAARVAGRR